MPPKELWRSCCGWACDFGAEAYNESIDDLRSGRDIPDDAGAVAEALEGLSVGAEGGPPKKSRPSRESPCLACGLSGAEAFGGAAREEGSVVLGLAGGVGTSPSMSMLAGGFFIGPGGWLDADDARCEVERSSCAFSLTILSGWELVLVSARTGRRSVFSPHRHRLRRPTSMGRALGPP